MATSWAQLNASAKAAPQHNPPPQKVGLLQHVGNFFSKTIPDFAVGAAKSIPQAAIPIGQALEGTIGRIPFLKAKPGVPTLTDSLKQTAETHNSTEKVGDIVGQVAQLFTPTGAEEGAANFLDHIVPHVADLAEHGTTTERILAKVVQGLTKAGARGADVAGKTLLQTESPKQALEQGAVAGATVPAEEAYRAVAKPASDFFTKLFRRTPALSEAEQGVAAAEKGATDAERAATTAAAARSDAAPKAVAAYDSMVEQVSGHKSALGTQFGQEAADLTKAKPNLKLNLTNDQVNALNGLKESKSFSLPKYVDQTESNLPTGPVGADFMRKNAAALEQIRGATQVSLTPSEAQDLITQLNRGTFKRLADGSLQVNQQMIDVANDIKASANGAFGDEWKKIYSNYSRGINAVKQLDDIVDLSGEVTASDKNRALQSILRLTRTPEGKLFLENALDDYRNVSGIDLADPVKAVQQIQDAQDALEASQSKLSESQKQLTVAQRKAAAEKAAKGKGLKNTARYLGRSSLGGALRIGIEYPILRALLKAVQGK